MTSSASSSSNLSMEQIFTNFDIFSNLAQNEQFPAEYETFFSTIDSIYQQYSNPIPTPQAIGSNQDVQSLATAKKIVDAMTPLSNLTVPSLTPGQMLKIQTYSNIASNICELATQNLVNNSQPI